MPARARARRCHDGGVDDSTDQAPAEPSRHRGDEQQLIDRLWDFGDPAASEERFREAADDDSHPAHVRAVMTTQLARAVGIQGRADEALALLDEVGSRGIPSEEVRSGVREAALAGSNFLVLDALHMLALNDEGHEEEWAAEGLDVLAGSRDPRVLRWGVALHNNLGWTMHDSGRAEAALAEFQLAVDAADRYGTTQQQHVARWSVARCLRTLGRNDEALELQRELARARPDDPYVQSELAELTTDESGGEPTIEA